ncbi:proline iminopeptidase-family hydrolase [Actinokineospora bangkokensis]|uniref:Proline iminopeptidase n=1 Tax=Actinokineospora bangkokensis TaxID=1193682 RepID=A0A1Q9LQ28_9PSEU|nr:proline iminopeptidase-family hydrolase [Actinokineospora bangkokensis]OLR94130.1 hypothetical protein BJP25_09960 [Actinokineospora bangkokensis]
MTTAQPCRSAGGSMTWRGRETWFRVVGDPGSATGAPLVLCHGGPGMTHDYLLPFSLPDRLCLYYDQFGAGRSGRGAVDERWTPELFLSELSELVDHVGFSDGYHLLGHSWGGMLALDHATCSNPGLKSVTAVSAFAKAADFAAGVARLVAALPPETRAAIEHHEAAGTTDDPEYQRAVRVFYRAHVCRTKPVPDAVLATLAALAEESTVYSAMMGPSEFTLTGSLRDWDATTRLAGVRVPALLVSGAHDEVTPEVSRALHEAVPGSRWELFEGSSHMSHVEEPERFAAVVGDFLAQHD